MKRLFALMLAMVLALSFAACSTAPEVTTGAIDDTTAPVETTAATEEITFTELSVHEGDDFSVVITDIDPESAGGYALNISLSNNAEVEEIISIEYIYETNEDGETEIVDEIEHIETSGKSLTFTIESLKANGTEIDCSFSTEVEAESKAFDQIVLDAEAIASLGTITEIEMVIKVYESSNTENVLSTLNAIIHPYGVSEVVTDETEG